MKSSEADCECPLYSDVVKYQERDGKEMLDQYGRTIDYIRISVTDRCNLRCIYCMPEEGIEQVRHEDILSFDEITRLCSIFVQLGISKIKITGGEPLVRKGLSDLIRQIKGIPGIESVTLTTNGILLKEQMESLWRAGIDSVNVSLDTLDAQQFEQITRRGKLSDVLDGIEEGLKYTDVRMKINCVPLAGQNEAQWQKLAGLAKEKPLDVRFIEMMPIGLGRQYHGKTQEIILQELEKVYGTARGVTGHFGNGPSTYVQFSDFKGKIGFISAISHQFCNSCNRVRVTSEGDLKLCLQYAGGTDLRALLRGGNSDEEIKEIVQKTIYQKPKSHHFAEAVGDGFEQKQMSSIGG